MWSDFPRAAQTINRYQSGLDILLCLLLSFQHQLGVQPSGTGQLLSILQPHSLHVAGTEHLPNLRAHPAQRGRGTHHYFHSTIGKDATVNERCLLPGPIAAPMSASPSASSQSLVCSPALWEPTFWSSRVLFPWEPHVYLPKASSLLPPKHPTCWVSPQKLSLETPSFAQSQRVLSKLVSCRTSSH